MPTLETNGITLAYTDGGDGPPLLLVHGYSAMQGMWEPNRAAIEERHRLVTIDLRGHGDTQTPDDRDAYTHDLAVADMVAVLDHLGIERAAIGGMSLGGYLSLLFYAQHPERVSALVLCCTGPGYRNPESREKWNSMARRRANAFEKHGLEALSVNSAETRTARHRSAAGLVHAAHGLLAQFDDRAMRVLPEIAVPTLVLVGEDDKAFVGPSEYMTRKIPGAELAIIPNAAHAANMDNPTAFDEAVLTFLEGV